jgi:hypothetical protein
MYRVCGSKQLVDLQGSPSRDLLIRSKILYGKEKLQETTELNPFKSQISGFPSSAMVYLQILPSLSPPMALPT